MTTYRQCHACRKFFPLKDGVCECGVEARVDKKAANVISGWRWRENLNFQAADAARNG